MVIYGDIVKSTVDGPGTRAVIHMAGCSIGCPGCFNSHMWNQQKGRMITSSELLREKLLLDCDGVTISGGEPTDQLSELIDFLRLLKTAKQDSIILYSGRTLSWLRKNTNGLWNLVEKEELVSILIDGAFKRSRLETSWQRGSTNQRIIPITNRHTVNEFQYHGFELTMQQDGTILVLGFPDKKALETLEALGDETD